MRRMRMSIKDIKIGTKLELEVTDAFNADKNNIYVSQLLDIIDDENLVIAAPIAGARLAFIPNSTKIVVVLNHPKNGLIAFNGILESKDTHDNIAVYYLKINGDFYSIQRRNNYRLEIMLDTYYYELQYNLPVETQDTNEISYIKEHTKNISGSGACIVTNNELSAGSHLFLKFELPDGTEIETRGIVIRSTRVDSNNILKYNTGVKFTSMSKKNEEMLIKFIFLKQKEILKQKRV